MHAPERRIQTAARGMLAVGLFATIEWVTATVAHALALPVPGAVFGLAVLVAARAISPRATAWTAPASRWMAGWLGALIVPAAVGLAAFAPLLAREWLPVLLVLLLATAATALFTATVYRLLAR